LTPTVPVAGTNPSPGVPQQPSTVPTLRTADCPVELDQSDVAQDDFDGEPASNQEPVPDLEVDFSQYDWLFTTSKGDRVGGVDAG
jgi:hypothetical protein